jgi:hypothetical protein
VGINAEVKKMGDRDVWRVKATTDMLAAGHEKPRKALAELVKVACENRWIDAGKAERWLEELEGGLTLIDGWPKYHVGLVRSGALEVKYQSTDSDSIVQEAQRFRRWVLRRADTSR